MTIANSASNRVAGTRDQVLQILELLKSRMQWSGSQVIDFRYELTCESWLDGNN